MAAVNEDTSLSNVRRKIKRLIEQDEVGLALQHLRDYLGDGDSDLHDAVSLQLGNFNRRQRQQVAGTVTPEQYQVYLAQIGKAVLDILEKLPDSPTQVDFDVPEEVRLEKIVGSNDLLNIAWLEQGLRVSRSVCLIRTPFGGGTGFLLAGGILMTNNHVLPSVGVAEQSSAEFNVQYDVAGQMLPGVSYRLDHRRFRTSPTLDYALVGVMDDPGRPPIGNWGHLAVDADSEPRVDEHVIIIGHPLGGPKQIALTANQVVNIWEHRLQYTTDTMEGSSGSPVFDRYWQVIAIHHAGGNLKANARGDERWLNQGILMKYIKPDAGAAWPDP